MPKATEKQIFFKTVGDMPSLAVSLFTMDYNKTGTWRNVRPVIDYGKCTFCAICWKYCPEPAIKLEKVKENNKEKLKPIIDYDYCKGCGICWTECPVGAIHPEEEAE